MGLKQAAKNNLPIPKDGRRTFNRKKVDGLLIECLCRDQSPLLGTAVNLSPEGLAFLLIEDALQINDRVRLTLHLLFPKTAILIEGVILRKTATDAGVLYGLRITSVTPDDLELREIFDGSDPRISQGADRRGLSERRTTDPNRSISDADEKRQRTTRRQSSHKEWRDPVYAKPRIFFGDIFDDDGENGIGGSKPIPLKVKVYPLFIAGKAVHTDKEEIFPVVEQAILDFDRVRSVVSAVKMGEIPPDAQKYIFARYAVGNSQTNTDAMRSAHDAGKEFRLFSLARRHRILEDIHDLLQEQKAELIKLMVIEGHPIRLAEWEYLGMESSFRPPTLRFFREQMNREIGVIENECSYLTRKADGVVCVSPPKNAPASVSLFAAFCLLAGNALIIKPPLRIPIACMHLWMNVVQRAVKANGGPDGTINIITGHSETILDEWLKSPLTNDIFFFGDSEKGLEIGSKTFQHGKKPILELSGNDFMVIWEDAPLRKAAESLLEGFLGSMQICMAPKKALIHPAIFEQFLDIFVPLVQDKVKVGLPSDPKVYLTPVVRLKEFQSTLQETVEMGGKYLLGGRRLNHLGEPDPRGQFAEASLVSICDLAPNRFTCVRKENFFPLMPLISLPENHSLSSEQIFQWMGSLLAENEFGLRTSVWTKSKIWASKFAEQISNSGMVRINSNHLAFTPYFAQNGGPGKSGGPFGEMNFPFLKSSHLQGISINWPGGD
jgi:acyl-CoA reductase-like NAD-dependent aldehyde dehydrogenase